MEVALITGAFGLIGVFLGAVLSIFFEKRKNAYTIQKSLQKLIQLMSTTNEKISYLISNKYKVDSYSYLYEKGESFSAGAILDSFSNISKKQLIVNGLESTVFITKYTAKCLQTDIAILKSEQIPNVLNLIIELEQLEYLINKYSTSLRNTEIEIKNSCEESITGIAQAKCEGFFLKTIADKEKLERKVSLLKIGLNNFQQLLKKNFDSNFSKPLVYWSL